MQGCRGARTHTHTHLSRGVWSRPAVLREEEGQQAGRSLWSGHLRAHIRTHTQTHTNMHAHTSASIIIISRGVASAGGHLYMCVCSAGTSEGQSSCESMRTNASPIGGLQRCPLRAVQLRMARRAYAHLACASPPS